MIVWDNHTCMPLRPDDEKFLPQLDRYTATGTNVVSINVGFGEQTPEQHLRMIAHLREWIARRPEKYVLAETAEAIERAAREGKLAILFDIEGARAIGDQLSLIQMYYDLGVRWMSIAYNLNNDVGGGCMDNDTGLTAFGKRFIDEMERTGMLVCCSHTGERTVRDVFDYAKRPVIFSHSNPRALWDHPRNIRDDVIVTCAKKGGVIGINGVGLFLPDGDISAAMLATAVDYVAKLAGIDHAGLSLDYVFDNSELREYLRSRPELFGIENGAPTDEQIEAQMCAFSPPETIPEIAGELRKMGYAESDVAKVMGGNWMRIARECWR